MTTHQNIKWGTLFAADMIFLISFRIGMETNHSTGYLFMESLWNAPMPNQDFMSRCITYIA